MILAPAQIQAVADVVDVAELHARQVFELFLGQRRVFIQERDPEQRYDGVERWRPAPDELVVPRTDARVLLENPKRSEGEADVPLAVEPSREPLYRPEEIYGVIPTDVRRPYDVREIIARIVDGSRFHEYRCQGAT